MADIFPTCFFAASRFLKNPDDWEPADCASVGMCALTSVLRSLRALAHVQDKIKFLCGKTLPLEDAL